MIGGLNSFNALLDYLFLFIHLGVVAAMLVWCMGNGKHSCAVRWKAEQGN